MSGRGAPGAMFRALRPAHWSKNALVFLPLVTGHGLTDPLLLRRGALAFVLFCLAASGGYLVNDVLDRDGDRAHPVKRGRPIASGALSSRAAGVTATVLVAMAIGLARALMAPAFLATLAAYVFLTLAYTIRLKRTLALDVIVLTSLYLLRIVAGGIATEMFVSEWLLALSLFFFLSLALLKRYAELRTEPGSVAAVPASRRPYGPDDSNVLLDAGIGSGFLSVLVFALYLESDQPRTLYVRPELLWLVGPLLCYWLLRLWLLAHRGSVRGDPLLFAMRDRNTWLVGAGVALLLYLATVGMPGI